jgi:hypothetical protein
MARTAAGVAASLAVLIMACACAGVVDAQPPTSSPESTAVGASESPAPEVTARPPTDQILATESLLTLEAFAARPKSEQLNWWSYVANENDIRYFAEEYQIVSGNAYDVLPSILDIDALEGMDVEDVIRQAEVVRLTAERFALSFEPTSLQAQKAMHAVFANNDDNPLYDRLVYGQSLQSEGLRPRNQASEGLLAQDSSVDFARSSQSLQYTEQGVPYVDISFLLDDDDYVFRMFAISIEDSYIEGWNMIWLPQEV